MANGPKKQEFRFAASTLRPNTASKDDIYKLQALLGRYGYLHGAYCPGDYDQATKRAVAQFQSFYRVSPELNGECDEETVKLLTQRR